MAEKEYNFNGMTYVQRPLVIGQVRQLAGILDGIRIPRGAGIPEVVEALGDKIMTAVAIVLTEKGKSPRDKDLAAMAGEMDFVLTPEDLIQVIDDFFLLNPISSLLERIGTMTEGMNTSIGDLAKLLTTSSSRLPPETLPDGTPSNGDIPSETSNPG